MALKIGILTLPLAENYGGILQAMSLYRFLHAQGHEVVLIDRKTQQVLWKKLVKEILIKVPFFNSNNLEYYRKIKLFRSFVENEIFTISKNYYTYQDLKEYSMKENFDVVLVGSDQVWRKAYTQENYKRFFLDFVDGSKTKKIAYAASFGKDFWEGENDSGEISKLLKEFDAISTRELSGVKICRETFGYQDASHVLDPTFLMDKKFYKGEIISNYDTSNIIKGGLLTYVLDEAEEKKDIIEFVKKSFGIESVQHLKGFKKSNRTYSVPEWIASFSDADFVVTDSYHGMIFSIIFEKNFVVIGNRKRGLDRFVSLLSLLDLEDRLVFSIDDIMQKKLDIINYETTNKKLEDHKKISFEFLGLI